jgi:hypothetical protein
MVFSVVKQSTYAKVLQRIVFTIVILVIVAMFMPKHYSFGDVFFKGAFIAIILITASNFFIQSIYEIGNLDCNDLEVRIQLENLEKSFQITEISSMRVSISTYVGAPVGISLRTSNGCGNKLEIVFENSKHTFFFKISNRAQLQSAYELMKGWETINSNIKVTKPII